MANDPKVYAGGMTAAASQKIVRFCDLAETFHLPVVNFVDQPGFVIGVDAEKAGTIRHGARALAAVYQATVPWVSIIVRKVFGVAGAAHGNASQLNLRYAWPSGDWGSLPLEGGIEAAYRRVLDEAAGPRSEAAGDPRVARGHALTVPDGGDVRDRGDHRPARHAAAAVRVGGRGVPDRPDADRAVDDTRSVRS